MGRRQQLRLRDRPRPGAPSWSKQALDDLPRAGRPIPAGMGAVHARPDPHQAAQLEWRARRPTRRRSRIFRETDDMTGYALVLDGFAALEWGEGERDRAMRIAGCAAALHDVQRDRAGARSIARRRASSRRSCWTRLRWRRRTPRGEQLTVDQAIDLALHRDDGGARGVTPPVRRARPGLGAGRRSARRRPAPARPRPGSGSRSDRPCR